MVACSNRVRPASAANGREHRSDHVRWLTTTVAARYREETPAVANVAVLAFLARLVVVLAQLIVFLAAIANELLSGTFALVVTGLALLATGLALERGRRKLLGRMAEPG